MIKKLLIAVGMLLLLAQAALAQEEDKPSVWYLAFGHGPASDTIQLGLLDALQAYGFINPEDRAELRMQMVIESAENSPIRFTRSLAGYEIDRLREMVAKALDQEPDVLVTVSASVTLAALHATYDMDDPPPIFFADVYNPYEAGIAEAPCIKPAHVIGSETINNYEEFLTLPLLQNPDIKTIGTIHNASDASGSYGARQIAKIGQSLGLTVEQAAVTSLADLALATDGLVSKGVEALLLPADATTMAGLPIIVNIANDNDIPTFYAKVDGIFRGGSVGAGAFRYFDQGSTIGLMVAAYLKGELDIASAGISAETGDMVVGINLMSADALDFSFSQSLQDRTDVALELVDGAPAFELKSEAALMEEGRHFWGEPEPLEAREDRDRAFLAGLECTPERIAEQQAELDAMDG